MRPLATHHSLPSGPGIHELESNLQHVRFALARVDGGTVEFSSDDDEVLIVVLSAPTEALAVTDGYEFSLPSRASVFADEPAAVYVPPGCEARLQGELLAGIFRASAAGDPSIAGLEPYLILPEDVASQSRGKGNFARRVRDILPAERPAARLLVGETINPPGNWSSSPPHKHDRDVPGEEAELEEIYLYRVEPRQGFGLQLSYSTDPPVEDAFVVRDLDLVSIASGYHPVVAGPGYSLYYLWCLAGQGRELLWRPDPAHSWVDQT